MNSDPGKPLKGADVLFGGSKVGVTDAEGAAEIKLAGRDGEVFDVNVACPKGFESPKTPVRVTLHRLAEEGKRPEYTVQCPPKTRTIVVAVRTDGVEDLPGTLLGRETPRPIRAAPRTSSSRSSRASSSSSCSIRATRSSRISSPRTRS